MITINSKPLIKDQVYTTTDYFLFKSIKGNRNKNLLHIDRLKKSMMENYLFTIIIVNELYEIIDGQHRFDVIKELGLPLHYVICKGYGLDEVHILNANSKTWKSDDYLEGYCNLGYKEYLTYREFQTQYGLGHSQAMLLLGHSGTGGDAIKEFYAGKFKVKNIAESKKKADLLLMIGNYYEGFQRRSFIFAFLRLLQHPNFEFSEFIQKLKQQPSSLTDCGTADQYISLIEEIYNYRRKVKVNLRYLN